MNGLRIYINTATPETQLGDTVFYSRRSDGPYYRWCYEETLARWRSSRIHVSDMSPKELCIATWKGVPAALKASLNQHYLD
jgi:hypothetical protein